MTDSTKADEKATETKTRATTAAEEKKADKQAEENRKESLEREVAVGTSTASAAVPLDDTAISQPPFTQPSTHVDKDGIERITSGTDVDGWSPAPTEPHESQVKAAAERNERFEREAKERQEAAKRANA
jgi:hypothetical protein